MNANQYINKITQNINCSGAKKKEIKKQLASDIALRQEQGEKLEDILSQMGSIKEIADSFNESFSEEEKKKYARAKKQKTILEVVGVLVLLILLSIYLFIPRSADIENSKYFEKAQVEDALIHTVELIYAENYDLLMENAIDQMKTDDVLQAIQDAKAQISDDWGSFVSYGSIYTTEAIQRGKHYAIGQITVQYENVTVTYTITYDQDMKLAGTYMR